LDGTCELEGVVGELSVGEDEEVGELAVEKIGVGEEQIEVEVDKHLLEGTVEALYLRVFFWGAGVGEEVCQAKGFMAFSSSPANSEPLSLTKQRSDKGGSLVSAEGRKNVWTGTLRNLPCLP